MKMLIVLFALLLLLGCEESEEKIEGSIKVIGISSSCEILSYVAIIDSSDSTISVSSIEASKILYREGVCKLTSDSIFVKFFGEYDSTGVQIQEAKNKHEMNAILQRYNNFVLRGAFERGYDYLGCYPKNDSGINVYYNYFDTAMTHTLEVDQDVVILNRNGVLDTVDLHETGIYSDTLTITDHPNYSEIALAYNLRVVNAGSYSYDQIKFQPEVITE